MTAYLVTGSRKHTLGLMNAVNAALTRAQPTFLILGDCPTGADAYAEAWAKANDVAFYQHIAKWRELGKRAGPARNSQMVKMAERYQARVLAFPRGRAAGTSDCVRKARDAGLFVEEL